MSDTFKKQIDSDKKHCQEQVAIWEYKLKEAESQLKYWQMQLEAIRAVSTRLMLNGWKAKDT